MRKSDRVRGDRDGRSTARMEFVRTMDRIAHRLEMVGGRLGRLGRVPTGGKGSEINPVDLTVSSRAKPVLRSADEWARLDASPPITLWHYTTARGALGIISSKSIYATHIRYLNDPSEVSYGVEVVRDACDRYLADVKNERSRSFLTQLSAALTESAPILTDAYVACFSEEEDNLNQWRLYAAEGGGYAVGASSAALKRLSGDLGFELVEMIYGKSKQGRLVETLLERACGLLERIPDGPKSDEQVKGIVRSTQVDLTKCIVRAKHDAFRNEQEWRLVCVAAERPAIKKYTEFGERGGLLVPRVKVPLCTTKDDWAIRVISCGPTLHPVLSLDGIRALTEKYGVGCKVRRSEVPLRG